jgi:hypothetical protein
MTNDEIPNDEPGVYTKVLIRILEHSSFDIPSVIGYFVNGMKQPVILMEYRRLKDLARGTDIALHRVTQLQGRDSSVAEGSLRMTRSDLAL